MGFKSLSTKAILVFIALDLVFNPILASWYFQVLEIGWALPAVIVQLSLSVLKVAALAVYIREQLRPYDVFALARVSERTVEVVMRADAGLQRVVNRLNVLYGAAWVGTYWLTFMILQSRVGQGLVFNSGAWGVAAFGTMGVSLGAFAVGETVVVLLTDSASGQCSAWARQHGVTLPRVSESLQMRIGAIALALAIAPTMCFSAMGYAKQIEGHEQQNSVQADSLVTRLAERVNPQAAPTEQQRILSDIQGGVKGVELALLDRRGRSLLPDADGELTTPSYGAQVVERVKSTPHGVIRNSGKAERIAYSRLEDGLIVVARVDVPSSSGYVLGAGLLAVVIALWAPLCALLFGRAITGPMERLITTTEKIVEEGKQSEMAALPVARNDEVGRLSERFNDLLEMMRDLSRAADAIAAGELRLEITRKGELPDAFRRMLESLRSMVREIRGTSVDLASAATEILAASQEQESAAASQSSAMEEINRTMESLSASAAHVSDSVQGVLANAEQTLTTTDRMVARITELSGHANRIGEILDVIREIADRSDLLALNGSLEASRAGDSGHGFALVAAEMRRLAERVTASVEDVKRLVSDIRDSGSSTVAATEEGRRLADGTTEAARQITFVTQQQRSGTEQVSESIRNITDVVTQAVSATAQTRTSAQGLKSQADRLAALVKRFELETSEAT